MGPNTITSKSSDKKVALITTKPLFYKNGNQYEDENLEVIVPNTKIQPKIVVGQAKMDHTNQLPWMDLPARSSLVKKAVKLSEMSSGKNLFFLLEEFLGRLAMVTAVIFFITELCTGMSIYEMTLLLDKV